MAPVDWIAVAEEGTESWALVKKEELDEEEELLVGVSSDVEKLMEVLLLVIVGPCRVMTGP